jgi:ATP-dependent protease ClpP protease subunit
MTTLTQFDNNAYLSSPQSDKLEQDFYNIPNIYLAFEKGLSPIICHAYVNGIIQNVNEFANLLHVLRTMRAKDRLILNINSPGGNLTTGAMVATAITSCTGHVTTVSTGFCASAAMLIWSAGHLCKVRPGSLMMFHCSSHFDADNSLQIRDNANRLINYVKYILSIGAVKKGHLLPEELNQILTKPGIEIYVSYETMMERLKGSTGTISDQYDPATKETKESGEDDTDPAEFPEELPGENEPEEEDKEDIKEGEV